MILSPVASTRQRHRAMSADTRASASFAARSPGARRRSRSTVKGGACQILFSFWYLPGEHFISLPLTHCFDPFGLSSFPQAALKFSTGCPKTYLYLAGPFNRMLCAQESCVAGGGVAPGSFRYSCPL